MKDATDLANAIEEASSRWTYAYFARRYERNMVSIKIVSVQCAFIHPLFRPGDNPNQCASQFNCPPPMLTLDNFVPFNSRFIDVGAGGPSPFTFTATTNATWLKLTPSTGNVSPSNPEVRVEATVDWDQVSGVQFGQITFDAVSPGQPNMSTPAFFVANKTVVPSGFSGKSISLMKQF